MKVCADTKMSNKDRYIYMIILIIIQDELTKYKGKQWEELFKGVGDGAPGREITCLPVNQVEMALPDPTQTAPDNWQAPCVIT